MTLREIRHAILIRLLTAFPDEAERKTVCDWLLCDILDVDFKELHLRFESQINSNDYERLDNAVVRLLLDEPLQYVTGKAYFMDLILNVRPGVLIPRPETEELCLLAFDYIRKSSHVHSVSDICSGSGCIALSIKKAFPELKVYGLDFSPEALSVSKENSDSNNLPIDWVQFDLLENGEAHFPDSQILICNPPYVLLSESEEIHSRVKKFEPHSALFVANDDPLLYYRSIFNHIRNMRAVPQAIFLEANPITIQDLVTLSTTYFPQSFVSMHNDFRGKARFVSVIL